VVPTVETDFSVPRNGVAVAELAVPLVVAAGVAGFTGAFATLLELLELEPPHPARATAASAAGRNSFLLIGVVLSSVEPVDEGLARLIQSEGRAPRSELGQIPR
jgi:hypothetical protein